MLTQERLRRDLHYDPNTGVFTRLRYKGEGYVNDGYLLLSVAGVQYRAHRLAFLYMTGELPSLVDHKNCDRLDNRWDNLRVASKAGNAHNASKRVDNTSGVKGVCWSKQHSKYKASIMVDKKQRHLGYFDDLTSAASAYAAAAVQLHQSFANLGETNVH